MAYSKKDFGGDLLIELSHGYDPLRLARWADTQSYRILDKTDNEVDSLLQNISCMSFGEEFYITEDELYDLAIPLLRPNVER